MSIALILYGSRARGDHRMTSDTDMLGITIDGNVKRNPSKRGVSFHEYPYKYMEKMCQKGDLFFLHIVSEGVTLKDSLELLVRLQNSFEYKNSYKTEKAEAAAIIWYCHEYRDGAIDDRFRKRLVWSIRTLIIADAAEQKRAIFSSKDLEAYSDISGLRNLIDGRATTDVDELLTYSKKICRKYYKLTRPQNRQTKSLVISWMKKKGSLAGSTPYYLVGKKPKKAALSIHYD